MTTAQQKLEQYLEKASVISLDEARAMNINAMILSRAVSTGKLHRLHRGVYASSDDILYEPLKKYLPYTVQIPEAVVALVSALNIHDLTDEEERDIWIAVPHEKKYKTTSKRKNHAPVRQCLLARN